MKKSSFIIIFGLVFITSLAYQNCGSNLAGKTDEPSSLAGLKFSCYPSDKPCLNYKLSLSNLSDKKTVQILFQGSVDQGVPAEATFSSQCSKTAGTLAQCPYNTNVSATITSNSQNTTVKGDGRTMTVSLFTSSSLQSEKYGNLKMEAIPSDSSCFQNLGELEIYDGDIVPMEEISRCEEEGFN